MSSRILELPDPPSMTDEDRAFLQTYDARAFPAVAVTVDIVILTIDRNELSVLLVQRGVPPFRGRWALPGGFVRPSEDLDEAAARELREEAGMPPGFHLEQLGTYGAPDRDPRMRVVSVAYLALVAGIPPAKGGDDADEAMLWPVSRVFAGQPRVAFDHVQIIADAVERARNKLEYTSLATSLVTEPFTIADLRAVYEAVWGHRLHAANFRRKVLATPGFVESTGDRVSSGRGWTDLYRRGTTTKLNPALLRNEKPD